MNWYIWEIEQLDLMNQGGANKRCNGLICGIWGPGWGGWGVGGKDNDVVVID